MSFRPNVHLRDQKGAVDDYLGSFMPVGGLIAYGTGADAETYVVPILDRIAEELPALDSLPSPDQASYGLKTSLPYVLGKTPLLREIREYVEGDAGLDSRGNPMKHGITVTAFKNGLHTVTVNERPFAEPEPSFGWKLLGSRALAEVHTHDLHPRGDADDALDATWPGLEDLEQLVGRDLSDTARQYIAHHQGLTGFEPHPDISADEWRMAFDLYLEEMVDVAALNQIPDPIEREAACEKEVMRQNEFFMRQFAAARQTAWLDLPLDLPMGQALPPPQN